MNKYRGVNVEPSFAPARDPEKQSGELNGGIVFSTSPQKLELQYSPDSNGVRVEFGALRAGYAIDQLGDTTADPGDKIYALGEHRFVLAQTTLYEKVFRLYNDGVVAATITYGGGAALTSLEITAANEITSVGTTSFVGAIAVDDYIYLTDMSTAANNNVKCRVTVVAANKLTLAGTPLTIQAADSACSLHKFPSIALIDSRALNAAVGAEWTPEITDGGSDDIEILDTLLSWKSFYNAVFFADGEKVFKWDQSTLVDDEGNDFPTTNLLEAVDDETTVTVNPAGGALDTYKFYYSLVVTGPSETGGEVTVSLWHAGVEIASKQRVIVQSSDTARVVTHAQEKIEVVRAIALDDVVTLKVKSLTQKPVSRYMTLAWNAVDGWEVEPKVPAREAYGRSYTFSFRSTPGSDAYGLEFYFDYGLGYVLHTTLGPYADATTYDETLTSDVLLGDVIGFKIIVTTAVTFTGFDISRVDWTEGFEVEVHGFNKTTDLDAKAGVEYSVIGTQANDLTLVRPNVSELTDFIVGRYLGIAADRLLVLQANGDPEAIQWCANSDLEDWEGYGTGTSVQKSRSSPIDALMALEMLTSNVGALFRQRSIMRVVPTGMLDPAFGFYPWIEQLGTESPFSVTPTPYGIVFLGHDKQIYLLTEGGFQAIGMPINEKFAITDLAIVEGVFNPTTQEFILSVPEDH